LRFFPAADVFANFGEQKMAQSMNQQVEQSYSLPCLTITESSDELASLCEQVDDEIKPTGFIERMYVGDVIALTWDILRLRRSKTGIINGAFLAALQGILQQLLCRRDYEGLDHMHAAEDLARGWFENERARTKVAKLLRRFGLDEAAVEAEAFRLRAEELERFDRMLALAEVRRDKALRSIADFRQSLAEQIKQSTDRILENDEVPRLVAVRKRPD
jgi:hypothetical protein